MTKTREELIGDRLRELRGERSQQEIAEALHVSPMAVSKYERGLITPSDEVKIAYAEYFNTTVQAIFFTS